MRVNPQRSRPPAQILTSVVWVNLLYCLRSGICTEFSRFGWLGVLQFAGGDPCQVIIAGRGGKSLWCGTEQRRGRWAGEGGTRRWGKLKESPVPSPYKCQPGPAEHLRGSGALLRGVSRGTRTPHRTPVV